MRACRVRNEPRVGGLYAIVNLPSLGVGLETRVGALMAGGVRWIQLRHKGAQRDEILAEAFARVDRMCTRLGARIVLNDAPALALQLGDQKSSEGAFWGVHLGQTDLDQARTELGPDWREQLLRAKVGLGISTHSEAQVDEARSLSPGYLGLGPIWPTSSKADTEAVVGLERLRAVCCATAVPLFAIGGIDLERAKLCAQAGAAGVACISALEGADATAIEIAARTMKDALRPA